MCGKRYFLVLLHYTNFDTADMTNAVKFRFACLLLLWLALAYLMVTSRPMTLKTLFILAASAIIVFVPMYKKYIRKQHHDHTSSSK